MMRKLWMFMRRHVSGIVSLLWLTVACASAAMGANGPAPPALGYDLAKMPWFASADLPPNSTAEKIRSLGTPTTPTVVLRSATGTHSGMLFCILNIPKDAVQSFAGRITFGDIDGEDQTFFNGSKIGETRGWGVTDFGIPRMYEVPTAAIRAGDNVVAVSLMAFRNKQTFGIKRGPLTFAFTSGGEHRSADVAPQDQRNPEAAKRAIFEADSELSSTERIHRKRPGFGRFGEFMFDGLPAVAEVSPTRIAARNGPVFEVGLDRVTSVGLDTTNEAPAIDPWHKSMRVQAIVADAEVQYSVHSNVLYPGGIISLQEGKVLPVRLRFPSVGGLVLRATADELKSAGIEQKSAELPELYLLCDPSTPSPPALLLLSDLTANVTQSNSQMEIALARKSADRPGRAYAWFPRGIRPVTFGAKPTTVLEAAAASDSNSTASEVLRHWLRLGAIEPTAVDEFFRVLPGEQSVRVYQVARYAAPPGLESLQPMALRPPQIDYAARAIKYPVAGQPGSPTGVLTFSGEVQCFAAEATTGTELTQPPADHHVQVNWYDLPVPPMKERGLLATPGQKQMRDLLQKWILSDTASTNSVNAVDALYKSRTQAFQVFSYLSAADQSNLTRNSTDIASAALGDEYWLKHTEPLSGLSYYWTYFIEGPYFQQFDQDWGNGLSLYGLATFVKYAGAWEFARKNWDAIERIFSWFTVTDDWEWMRASNSPHGHGTGAGDCESATLAACIAYARLAEGCGRNDERDYGLYMAARAAVFAVSRFAYDDFARETKLSNASSMVLGFHEGHGFLLGELDRYPWNITSIVSGNGVQPGNFDVYLKYASDQLRAYEQAFESAYPNWSNPKAPYAFPTLYQGNSGYITLPHIYLRARLGMESTEVLHDLLLKTAENSYLWWLAPPVIAEVMHSKSDGAYVADWGRCAFLGGEMQRENDADKRRVRCIINFDNREAPDWVEIVLPKKAQHFLINDGPIPLTDISMEGTVLKLRLRRPGRNSVSIQY